MRPSITNTNLCRLLEWRQRHRLSIKDISSLSGISEAMLNLVERGKRNLSTLSRVRLARALGLSVDVLFSTPEFPIEELRAAALSQKKKPRCTQEQFQQ